MLDNKITSRIIRSETANDCAFEITNISDIPIYLSELIEEFTIINDNNKSIVLLWSFEGMKNDESRLEPGEKYLVEFNIEREIDFRYEFKIKEMK